MRIFLPATASELRAPELAPRRVHAVTDDLRADFPDYDDEDLEFAAQSAAAAESLHILRYDRSQLPVRVVLAADVDKNFLAPAKEATYASAVDLTQPVAWEDVVCLFVDEAAARELIETARVDDVDLDAPMLWYDRSELDALTDSLLGD